MFQLRRTRTGSDSGSAKRSRPALTARWLKDAVFAHRLAFEREMERDRDVLERRYKAYIKQENTRPD
ncbi:MAG: hypothetical protein ACODAB_06860 [Gemmatimonadota bacterium]